MPSGAAFRLCGRGWRLLSSALIRQPKIKSQAGQRNNNWTKHQFSLAAGGSAAKREISIFARAGRSILFPAEHAIGVSLA